MNNHIDHTRKAFHLYGSACDFQFLTMNERIVTLGTLVYFLSSVDLYVSLKVASLCARKVALYTSERLSPECVSL